jgi:hypothetical protein
MSGLPLAIRPAPHKHGRRTAEPRSKTPQTRKMSSRAAARLFGKFRSRCDGSFFCVYGYGKARFCSEAKKSEQPGMQDRISEPDLLWRYFILCAFIGSVIVYFKK